MSLYDALARKAYQDGARCAAEAASIYLPPAILRELEDWLRELERWSGDKPPPPPHDWPNDW
ncbi:MAG: hypothetical protein EOP84_32250 [Verrucomicrobiaceae bacterium]|nr:MAG: hypothetical protein EOP84_32250 [Verrucomicrobiaceae bacterium]